MGVWNKANICVASVSIVLYCSLFAICAHYCCKFSDAVRGGGGPYGKVKFLFFLVLAGCCLLELPMFIGCVADVGPGRCMWDEDQTHDFAWGCHIVASCGYMYTVISTAILWSDVVQKKDGFLFNSAYPLDITKRFFRILYAVYCTIVFCTVVFVAVHNSSSHKKESKAERDHARQIQAINYVVIPFMLVLITLGCFVTGLQLRSFLIKVQLDIAVLRKVLLRLNWTLFLICSSYLIRALLVLSRYKHGPTRFRGDLEETWHYVIWVPITQWFPYLLCSLFLVGQMKAKTGGTAGAATAAAARQQNSSFSNQVELKGGGRLSELPTPSMSLGPISEYRPSDRSSSQGGGGGGGEGGWRQYSSEVLGRTLSYLVDAVDGVRGSLSQNHSLSHSHSHSDRQHSHDHPHHSNSDSFSGKHANQGNFFDHTAEEEQHAVGGKGKAGQGQSQGEGQSFGSWGRPSSHSDGRDSDAPPGPGAGAGAGARGRGGSADEHTGVDHFFTLSALHARSNQSSTVLASAAASAIPSASSNNVSSKSTSNNNSSGDHHV
jgi:hypothetical protein